MKKITIIILTFILISLNQHLKAQQIENFRVRKLNDKLNIFYDLTQEKMGQQFDIKALCSDNGGTTFDIPLITVSGDIGKEINGGKNKVIVWDVLSDREDFKGNDFVFKITAIPCQVINPTDYAHDFNFELANCYKQGNLVVSVFKITNNGPSRDLKLPNRLARIYDDNNNYVEAHVSKLGKISGNYRHSVPTLTFNENQTELAVFRYKVPDGFSNRLKLLELGAEILEITYGLDYKSANLQFKDISLSSPERPSKAEFISESMSIDLGPDIKKIKDIKPPELTFTKPLLADNKPITVNSEELILEGNITDDHGVFEFTINGMDVPFSDDGKFKADVYFVEGNNTIFVRAVDIFENAVEKNYDVIYKPLKKEGQRLTSAEKKSADATLDDIKTGGPGKYYALLIGVSNYSDPEIIDLEQPETDAEKLYNTLINYYTFDKDDITLLKSPTREQIISEMDRINKLITEDDNLLVFYAGHGYWDTKDEVGYWLPSDAKQANTANWIRNSTIRDYLRTIGTKHTLLIADACFSGGIFKTRKAFADAPKSIQKLYELPSRKAMTSGTLQEVPDKSVFLLYLNKRLKENTQPYISAEELFSSFKIAVLNNSPNVPQYGEIKDTGDEGGDFVFVKR
ncbi:MAG: caspase family protein [Bacteroidota bacterium]|nr:caspase family protein [Bacteroidota bacterium]